MTRPKTTKAETFAVRLNPETSEQDRVTLEIIQKLQDEGWKFKQIVQDAILFAGGRTPEMFSKVAGPNLLGSIESLLERFADDLFSELRRRGTGNLPDEETDTEGISATPFAKKFTKSFMQRQAKSGDDE